MIGLRDRRCIPEMRWRATGVPLAFAVLLVVTTTAPMFAQAQSFMVLHRFTNTPDGAGPVAGLIRDSAGNLYGTTAGGGTSGFGTVVRIHGARETVLYSFTSTEFGVSPTTSLVRDKAGNLFGSTNGQNPTIFKLDTTGHLTPVAKMFSLDLSIDSAGNLYGSDSQDIFEIDLNGKFTVLYSFPSGDNVNGDLVLSPGGAIYGTTYYGGLDGCGSVFKLSRGGKKTVLYNFDCGEPGGKFPAAGLVRDNEGNLYGTTTGGGGRNCARVDCGTVFRLTMNSDGSWTHTVLHGFEGGTDGAGAGSRLVIDPAGNLYGTTVAGGGSPKCPDQQNGCGTVFRVSPAGKETVLHMFNGGDGRTPRAGLVRDPAGHLYGTTTDGAHHNGLVFKVTT